MTTIASILVPVLSGRLGSVRTSYRHDLLGAFDDEGLLLATYPSGTALDVALASADYEDRGDSDSLTALLRLEARDGNVAAAEILARYSA